MSFCNNCGKPLSDNLNYCSSCGTRVEAQQPVILRQGTPMLAIGAVFLGIVGLIGFYPIMTELLHSGVNPPAIFLILVAYLVAVILMFSVLTWQSRKGTTEVEPKGNRASEGFGGRDAFRGINTAQLPEPTRQPASVTEHTTRTLDQVPFRER
jgi:hypothetical protein